MVTEMVMVVVTKGLTAEVEELVVYQHNRSGFGSVLEIVAYVASCIILYLL